MLVKDAKSLAREWVLTEAADLSAFAGAYLAGSVNWLADDDTLPPTSDLDVNLVFAAVDVPERREKLHYRGLLLEPTHLSMEQLRSPEAVLGHYHLAGGLHKNGILADPSGRLTELQADVAREYARREWVRRRCEHARRRVVEGLDALDAANAIHDQVIGWLFPTGVTTHVLLVAGLRNPTVRRRYAAVRELLHEYGHLEFHETLLALLGCADMSRGQVEEHLTALKEVFDVAAAVMRSPFSFASDISPIARPIAVDGSREMIESGLHREAVFWIAVTSSRCRKVLAADAPELLPRFDPGYRGLLADLGITSFADLQRRSERVRAHLPQIWEIAEAIMAANPEIED